MVFSFLKPQISIAAFSKEALVQILPGFQDSASEADHEMKALSPTELSALNYSFRLFRPLTVMAFLVDKAKEGKIRKGRVSTDPRDGLEAMFQLAFRSHALSGPFSPVQLKQLQECFQFVLYEALKECGATTEDANREADEFLSFLGGFQDAMVNYDNAVRMKQLGFLLCQEFSEMIFDIDIKNESDRWKQFVCFRLANYWWKVANTLLDDAFRRYRVVIPQL